MPSIHFQSVSFSYTSAVDLLTGITFDLGPGWSGLVGANGSRKSTVLSLIEGRLDPQSGAASVDGIVGVCPQAVDEQDANIVSFAEEWDGNAYNIRRRLDLEPEDVTRWTTLSPGERKRWRIGAVLAGRPDILLLDEPTNHLDRKLAMSMGMGTNAWCLILDEPTNHLDLPSIERLESALAGYPGAILMVTHDEHLAEAVTNQTWRIDELSGRSPTST